MSHSDKGHRRIGSAGRLASLHAVVLAVVLGAVVFALIRSFSASYENAAAGILGGQLREYQQGAVGRPASQGLRAYSIRFLETHPLAAGDTTIIAIKGLGNVVTPPGRSHVLLHDPAVQRWLVTPPPATIAFASTIGGTPVELIASPIRSSGKTVGTYVAATDLSQFVSERSRVLELSVGEAGIALLVGVASAFFLLRSLLRRVGRITTTANAIGAGSLEQRLGEQGDTDEVGELARTFDAMLDRLDTSMKSQRRLLSDVSHQLRTPVTVARGHLEVLHRAQDRTEAAIHETLELVIDELDHMTGLIERLLTLGRAMEPELLTLEPVALREFLPSILDTVRVLAPRQYLLRDAPAVTVQVDRQQVRGAILNLVDNAIHATADGGAVTFGATVDPSSGAVRVEVEDSGAGIPARERAAALERFSRPGARDEDGSGLGLAIARAVAIAHGGTISIDQSPQLGGARVAIVLPASSVVTEVD